MMGSHLWLTVSLKCHQLNNCGSVLARQMTTEAEDAKVAAAEATIDSMKLRQELEQAMAHTSTLESRLQAALMETEAARASEVMALQEVCLIQTYISI
jgi:hypothetical protein